MKFRDFFSRVFRGFFSVLMLVLLLVLLWPGMAWAAFSDVTSNHPRYAAVQWMESRQVIQGYQDGTFRPEHDVNRAEALKIILLASGIEIPEANAETDAEVDATQESLFPDVKSEQWFYPYVKVALERDIVGGYPDGTFRPERTVNLAELLKMIYLANGEEPPSPDVSAFFYADVANDAWFAPYVADAKIKQLIEPRSDGILHPDWPATRGDLIEAMYRFSYLKAFDKTVFPWSFNWPLYQHADRDFAFKIPFGWQLLSATNGQIILWWRDEANGQVTWSRMTPNAAVVTLLWDPNEANLSTKAFFDQQRTSWEAYDGIVTETNTISAEDRLGLLMEYEGPYEFLRDTVVSMPSGAFVVVHGAYGKGLLSEHLAELVTEIQQSVQYSEAPELADVTLTPAEAKAQARLNIQVDGQGQASLDLFEDHALIETDTIGVGTGPVDYFYSAWANITLKYERSFDVILDIAEGQTTAF